jgi:hypothetical protein
MTTRRSVVKHSASHWSSDASSALHSQSGAGTGAGEMTTRRLVVQHPELGLPRRGVPERLPQRRRLDPRHSHLGHEWLTVGISV